MRARGTQHLRFLGCAAVSWVWASAWAVLSQHSCTAVFPHTFNLRKALQNCRWGIFLSCKSLLLGFGVTASLIRRAWLPRKAGEGFVAAWCAAVYSCAMSDKSSSWEQGIDRCLHPSFHRADLWAIKICVHFLLGTYGLKERLRIKAWLYWNEWQNSHSLWIVKMICRAP